MSTHPFIDAFRSSALDASETPSDGGEPSADELNNLDGTSTHAEPPTPVRISSPRLSDTGSSWADEEWPKAGVTSGTPVMLPSGTRSYTPHVKGLDRASGFKGFTSGTPQVLPSETRASHALKVMNLGRKVMDLTAELEQLRGMYRKTKRQLDDMIKAQLPADLSSLQSRPHHAHKATATATIPLEQTRPTDFEDKREAFVEGARSARERPDPSAAGSQPFLLRQLEERCDGLYKTIDALKKSNLDSAHRQRSGIDPNELVRLASILVQDDSKAKSVATSLIIEVNKASQSENAARTMYDDDPSPHGQQSIGIDNAAPRQQVRGNQPSDGPFKIGKPGPPTRTLGEMISCLRDLRDDMNDLEGKVTELEKKQIGTGEAKTEKRDKDDGGCDNCYGCGRDISGDHHSHVDNHSHAAGGSAHHDTSKHHPN